MEVIEKIKKGKIDSSNRMKAANYGKNIKKSKINEINTKNYFSENLHDNNNIKNIYEDNRLDFQNFDKNNNNNIIKNIDDDEITEFFNDDNIKINNYDFNEDILELQRKREYLNDKVNNIKPVLK